MDAHKNFSSSLVATAPSPASSGTSLVVTAAEGTIFPAVPFNATVWPASANPTVANAEIVRVTARTTDTFTITRAQEGSSARTVVVGDQIAATITAKTLTDAETMVLIYDETLGADTASFDVQSIASTYKHLKIFLTGRSTRAGQTSDFVTMRFNNDSGANYDLERFQVLGIADSDITLNEEIAQTSFAAFALVPGATAPTGARGQITADILNYAETTFRKNFVAQNFAKLADSTGQIRLLHIAGEWRSTAAVNRITLAPANGNWLAGSRLTLYGLN